MAVSNIPSGSDCGVNPKAEVQPRRGDDRSERVAGQSVKLNGNRYQSERVSSHSQPGGYRTADKNKSQGKGYRQSERRFQFSSPLALRFYHDNERVPEVHHRKGNQEQITGMNRGVVTEYIEEKKKASDVIAVTISVIKKSRTFEEAWEAVTNVYHPSIPGDKLSCLKKDPGSVNTFLNKLYNDCTDTSELFECAKRTLELLVKERVTCNLKTHTYLMIIYDKVSDIKGAECLLKRDKVVSGNPEDWLGGYYHLGSITLYLKLCLKIKRYQEAGTLIDALIKLTDNTDRAEPLRFITHKSENAHLVTVILEYCTAVGNFELAKKIFSPENDYCLKWKALRNQYVYNAFLILCLESGQYHDAGSIIELLINNTKSVHVCDMNIWPNFHLVLTMLKYCVYVKNYSLARLLTFGTDHQSSYISRWEIKSNEAIYKLYIKVCLKTGKTQDIELVINELSQHARDKNSDPSQRPTKDSCQVILEYCLETKNLSLVNELLFGVDGKLSLIRQWGIAYSILFFNLHLRVCTNAGEYQQAEQAIKEFINRAKHPLYKSLDPDRYTAGAILEFCKAAGNVDFVKKIVFSGKADRSCVDLRDVKINSICLADYISACAELRMFQEAKEIIDEIIKSADCGQPYLSVCPDVNIAVAILKYCEQRGGDIDLADLMVFGNEKQQSYLSKWHITPNFEIYARWAVIHKNNFKQALNKLIEKRICVKNLGYLNGEFDTHIDQVFENKYCVDDNGKKFPRTPGLPSEFAEALFGYHLKCKCDIKQVITGCHGTGVLFDKFTDVLQTKFKFEIEVSHYAGRIEIKKTKSETVKPED